MTIKDYQRAMRVLITLVLLSLAALSLKNGVDVCVAQEQDTVKEESTKKVTVKIEAPEEKDLLRIRAGDEKADVSKEIIISENGITVNGKKVPLKELIDSAKISVSIESGSIVKFGEPIVVKEEEIVNGDLVSFGGQITVAGTVTGDVAVIGANIHLMPTGIIKGDVLTFGGSIQQEPGGQIRGQRAGVLPEDFRIYAPLPIVVHPFRNLIAFGLPLLFFVIISMLFVILAGFFVPRHVERIGQAIETEPLKSILLGFAAWVIFLPLFLLLCVTIIGIPVALIAQPIAYFIGGIMGFAGVSLFVGTKLQRGTSLRPSKPIAKILLGALIIEAALILAWFITLGGQSFAPLFWLFYLIGWIIFLVASLAGMGAAIWTRFGIRPVPAAETPMPTVAPPPDAAEDTAPELRGD